jgi:hypothetical protein
MKKNYTLYILLLLSILFVACSKNSDTSGNAVTGAGGSTAKMTIYGNYLYLINNADLQTYDISQPEKTILLNTQNVGWNANIETIFPYRDKLFIGSQLGMYVYDISQPKYPKLQGTATHFRSCDPVVADDSYAYVTLRNNNIGCGGTLNQLNIYDIQGAYVLTPQLVGALNMDQPNGLGYKGNILYVCTGAHGLSVVDVTDKTKPKEIMVLDTGETYIDVICVDNLLIAYIVGGIELFDISTPADPKQLSIIKY